MISVGLYETVIMVKEWKVKKRTLRKHVDKPNLTKM